MADYPISNVSRRVVYSGSAGVGPYAFSFPILVNTDIAVYKNSTLLTLTTNYTVTLSPTTGTGSITLVSAATGSDTITLVGARAIQRSTDFVTGGDFFANTLNTELDSEVIFVQQVAETAERSLKAPVTDPTSINMTMPAKTVRAGKFLIFDANGNPSVQQAVGVWRGNWAASTAYVVYDLIKDTSNSNVYICITAHTSSGSQPISSNADVAKWALVVDAAAASTSATNAAASASAASTSASNASTSASNASTSASNAAASASQAAASYDAFDDRYLGAKASNPTVDNDGNTLLTGALYWNTTAGALYVWSGTVWDQAAFDVSGTGVISFNTRSGDITLTSGDVTSALTYTPLAPSAIGTTVQAYDADLTAIAGLAKTADNFIVGNGTTWVLETPAQSRTSLGLGTAATMTGPSGTIVGTTDTQTLTNKTLTSPTISSITNTGTVTLPTSTDTLVGRATTDTLTNKTITGTKETVFTITDGAAFEINPANGGLQIIVLGASRTPRGTNFTAGQSVTLHIDDGAAYSITWTDATFGTGGVTWVGNSAPTLATSGYTIVELWKVGSKVYGALVGNVA